MILFLFRKHIKLKRTRQELLTGGSVTPKPAKPPKPPKKEKKKKPKESKLSYLEQKNLERRKLWAHIVKKVKMF